MPVRNAGGAWPRWVGEQAEGIRAAGRWREPRSFDAAGPQGRLVATGQGVVSFASNDYLGLSQDPRLIGQGQYRPVRHAKVYRFTRQPLRQ